MIGIFGGTFDPVHNGHLKTLEYVHKSLSLECIFLVPLGHAVHRGQPLASAKHRYEMLLLAVAQHHDFVIDDREIRRQLPSYTVDTLESFHQELPQTPMAFIIGSDAFNHFHQWHKPQRILELANIVVMERPGHPLIDSDSMRKLLAAHACTSQQDFIQSKAGKIIVLQVPRLEISSSAIRKHLLNGDDISEFVPEPVARLIRLHDLYGK